jgi:hypothetical protein
MQRMLALPVSPGESEPRPETTVATPRGTEQEPGVEEVQEVPPAPSSEFTAFLTPSPLAEPDGSAGEVKSPNTDPTPAEVTEEHPSPPPSRHRQVGWGFRPLLWMNKSFDQATVGLGAPGRWLRGPRGRTFLGVAGLLLLGSAVAWGVLDWMGWPW